VNDFLVHLEDLGATLNKIHALIGTLIDGEDSPKNLKDARVSTGGGSTANVSSVRRYYIRRRRGAVADGILGKSGAKRLMCYIPVEPLMGHPLDHAHDEWSESTRSEGVDGDVSNLINDVGEGIEVLILHN
jgi:hypothetical protein